MVARQLKIAMLSTHSCPVGNPGAKDTGGMSVYVREIARELGKQGHLVDIYTRIHNPEDNQTIELGQNARLIHLKAGEDGDINKLAVYAYLPEFACNLESFRKHNNLRYDLIFSHYWLSGCVGESIKHWWDVPHVTMFHTLGAVKNAIGIGEDEPELRIESERHLVKNCHRLIAATKKEKDDLIQYYGASSETVRVIPCGVNLDLFQPVGKEMAKERSGFNNDKIVLFVGRIEPLKGIDRLLWAITHLKNKQSLRLVIIGGDERSQHEIEKLRRLSQDLHIQDSVTFLGLISQERLPLYYSAADICVIPSYYESFGLVALESLACGTPVVMTQVGGAGSIIRDGETGYVVKDNTPHQLADKIARLLSESQTTNSRRDSVAKFSWSNIAEAIADECQTVLADYPT